MMTSREIFQKLMNAEAYKVTTVTKPDLDTIVIKFRHSDRPVVMKFSRSLSGWTPSLDVEVTINDQTPVRFISCQLTGEFLTITKSFWQQMDEISYAQQQDGQKSREREVQEMLAQSTILN